MQLYLNPYYLNLQGELYKYPGYIMLIIHLYFTCYFFFSCFYHGMLRRERDYSSAQSGFMREVRTLACASVRIRFYSFARVFPFLCFYHGILRRERDYSSAQSGFMRKVRTLACASVRIRFYGYIGGVFFSLPLRGKLRRERDYSSAFCGFMRKVRTLACASVRIRFYGYIGGVFFSLPLAGKAAEREGFEPSIRFWRIHTFQACAFDHSAISPEYQGAKILKNPIITMLIQCNFTSNGSMQVIYNCFTACTLSQ